MNIGTKYILVNKQLEQVKNDFKKLTGHTRPEDISNKLEIFYENINENKFKFYSGSNSRLASPILRGEFIKKNNNQTLIKIKMTMLVIDILLIIFLIVFFGYLLIPIIISKWQERNIYLNIFLIILGFSLPIINCGHYFYHLINMINDFNLYTEGYYDKYLT
jgi:hypothetical protein